MIQGMKKLPQEAAEQWHKDDKEEGPPPYLLPFNAAAKYHKAKLRLRLSIAFTLGVLLTGGVGLLMPAWGLVTWLLVLVAGVVTALVFGVLTLTNYLKATQIVSDVDRGIKIVDRPDDVQEKAA